uniref:Uncharacterized protein n=1 Tax=Rhizophora mucronata TaxID=61149 RepID=A0A2P2QE34_RHIMU
MANRPFRLGQRTSAFQIDTLLWPHYPIPMPLIGEFSSNVYNGSFLLYACLCFRIFFNWCIID